MRTAELFAFAHEREMVRQRRAAGLPRPWTDDPILQRFRFCNVYREYDSVTTWLRENWREPNADDPDLWFAMVVARHINNIPTLAAVPFPLPWNPEALCDVTSDRKRRGLKNFSPAYMISTNGIAAPDKMRHLCEYVFNPLWQQRAGLRPRVGDTLTAYHILLGQMYGLASFLTGQVIGDVKFVEPLWSATDRETFACSGPGSRRGLNRVLERPVDTPWREDDWRLAAARLREATTPMFLAAGMPVPSGQDINNICCEYDKWSRVKNNEGRKPKQLFPGASGAPLPHSRQINPASAEALLTVD